MNTKWQLANLASQKSLKAVWTTVNCINNNKIWQINYVSIKQIKNKEFVRLVCKVNSAISSYGKFKFSELALRSQSVFCREPWTETSHMYSSFLVFFKMMIIHRVIMIRYLLNVRHSARTLHLTPLSLLGTLWGRHYAHFTDGENAAQKLWGPKAGEAVPAREPRRMRSGHRALHHHCMPRHTKRKGQTGKQRQRCRALKGPGVSC